MRQFVQEWFGPIFTTEGLQQLLGTLLHAVLLLLLGYLVLKVIDIALRRVGSMVPHDRAGVKRVEQRAETLRHIVRSVGKAVIGLLLLFVIAIDYDVDVSDLLTGAGVIGLAVGFGAQSLIKDILAGFFIILEDQYGVGDVIRIGDQDGVVEEMTLRVTVLRNFEGQVHVIPNGTIQTVTVLTKDWSRAVVDLTFSHSENLTRVFEVLSRTNEKLARDMPERVLEKPQVLGIERLSDEGVTVRLAVKTPAGKQGDVLHEWRRRIKDTLQQEGIEIPRRNTVILGSPDARQ